MNPQIVYGEDVMSRIQYAINEPDGLGDVCDPDDDNDGVNDYQDPPPPSDTPFSLTTATGIVSTSLPGQVPDFHQLDRFVPIALPGPDTPPPGDLAAWARSHSRIRGV